MPARRLEHRLAAVVVADVVGYTRLMERDEAGTLNSLQTVRTTIVNPATARFGGRIIKSTGDGWLAEFPSVTDAVESSLEIQHALTSHNAAVTSAQRLELRIGVNLGEIIADGDDIYGTGVNVAARLEAIAKPGGVVVSNAVREQLRGMSELSFEDLGEHVVKNLTRPLRCFSVDARRSGAPFEADAQTSSGDHAERGSIAVLPFDNFSSEVDQEYFADGMVDDIITALSRFKWLRDNPLPPRRECHWRGAHASRSQPSWPS